MGADMRAQAARQDATKAARAADRAEAEAWSVRMEGYGGPAQPSPTIGQCLNGGYGWLEIECCQCKTRASLPRDAIRRARDTPIWKLELSFRCRSCGTRGYKPPVRMIKLTEQREITPYNILMRSGEAYCITPRSISPLPAATRAMSRFSDERHRARRSDARGYGADRGAIYEAR